MPRFPGAPRAEQKTGINHGSHFLGRVLKSEGSLVKAVNGLTKRHDRILDSFDPMQSDNILDLRARRWCESGAGIAKGHCHVNVASPIVNPDPMHKVYDGDNGDPLNLIYSPSLDMRPIVRSVNYAHSSDELRTEKALRNPCETCSREGQNAPPQPTRAPTVPQPQPSSWMTIQT